MFRLTLRRALLLSTKPPTTTFLRLSSTAGNTLTSAPGLPVTVPVENTDIAETVIAPEVLQKNQAPNRSKPWSSSQNPRSKAMVGPRFEQTDLELQPRPWAAIELVHEEPVRFSPDRVVVCDGGGGPAGHPKIFINVDKPEVVNCNYCSLPFAWIHHKKAIVEAGDSPYPIKD